MTSGAAPASLTRQAREGVRRVPWKTVLAGAGGASAVALLAVAGFVPLIAAVASGALSIKEVQDWLANLGANALSGWVADWTAGTTREALADPAERERRAAELEQRAAADPAIAAALAALLPAIDAVPQSLAALQDEVGAQSDLLLAQHALLARLSADVERAGLGHAELQRFVADVTRTEAYRVIAAIEDRADRSDARLVQALAALRALVSISGQTGDVTIGDVAGRDIHKPTVAPGGIYAPGGTVNLPLAQPAPQQALHQLRAPAGDFVGREAEIAKLTAALSGGAVATISGLAGMGGIGKTELAMQVANDLLDYYPDAQIVLALQGSRPIGLPAAQALQTVIRAFVPEAPLPDDEPGLLATYRHVLSGKRVLILADDAQDAAQVRPLLPPEGSALLITSRQRFSLPGMLRVDLERLGEAEAVALLCRICDRLSDAEAGQLAAACGRLPLALRIAGGVLANDRTLSAARFLERLADERRLLAALVDPDDLDDPDFNVAASIALSYDLLDPAAQATLCGLGVFVAGFDLAAAGAVLEEADLEALGDRLGRLYRRSLLEYSPAQARYDLHELVQVFALGRLGDGRRAARLRHAQHYIAVAGQARGLYLAGGDRIAAGLALFDRERANLDAARRWLQAGAGDAEVDVLLIADADATAYIGDLRYGMRGERIPQLDAALAAAQRQGRRDAQGPLLGNLGLAYYALGDARRAIDFHRQALVVSRDIGARRGEGAALGNLGLAYYALGDARTAIDFHQQHRAIAREIGDRRGEGAALGNLGLAYADLGDARTAIECFQQHLAIAREIGDHHGEGAALGNLGLAYADLGDARTAIDFYQQDLAVAREIGDRRGEGTTLGNLGLAYYALGDARTAIAFSQQHLAVARETGDRRGEGNALGSLGLAYADLGDARTASDLYQQHLAIAREIGDRRNEGTALGSLGLAYADSGDTRRAIDFFQQHLAIAREIGDRRGEAITSWNLGRAYVQEGRVEEGLRLLELYVAYEAELGHPDAERHAALVTYVRQHGRLPDKVAQASSEGQEAPRSATERPDARDVPLWRRILSRLRGGR